VRHPLAWAHSIGSATRRIANVIGDQQGTGLVKCHCNGPATRLAGVHKAGDDVLRHAAGVTIRERHEDNFVAIELPPIPAAVLADEGAAAICVGEFGARIEGKAERSDMELSALSGTIAFSTRSGRRGCTADRGTGRNSCKASYKCRRPAQRSDNPAPNWDRAHPARSPPSTGAPVCGSQLSPFGLRRPLAKMRQRPEARSTSQMAARFSCACMPLSVMLLFEPTPTYSSEPSRLASRLLVQ
jgi:hypothetical protein